MKLADLALGQRHGGRLDGGDDARQCHRQHDAQHGAEGTAAIDLRGFVDDKLNGLLDAIAAETDAAKRLQLTGDVQRYLLAQAYVIPIFEEPQAFAGATTVKDVGFEAVGRPSFYATWLAKP